MIELENVAYSYGGGANSSGVHSVQRLREIAVATLLEGTAQDRLTRALRSKSRVTGEPLNLKPGDLVDFCRAPFITKMCQGG